MSLAVLCRAGQRRKVQTRRQAFMLRLKVEYQRRKQVIEKGYVTVDVEDFASIADVYKAAYEKQFTEKLAQEEEVIADDWDFLLKQGQQYEPAPPPKPA